MTSTKHRILHSLWTFSTNVQSLCKLNSLSIKRQADLMSAFFYMCTAQSVDLVIRENVLSKLLSWNFNSLTHKVISTYCNPLLVSWTLCVVRVNIFECANIASAHAKNSATQQIILLKSIKFYLANKLRWKRWMNV